MASNRRGAPPGAPRRALRPPDHRGAGQKGARLPPAARRQFISNNRMILLYGVLPGMNTAPLKDALKGAGADAISAVWPVNGGYRLDFPSEHARDAAYKNLRDSPQFGTSSSSPRVTLVTRGIGGVTTSRPRTRSRAAQAAHNTSFEAYAFIPLTKVAHRLAEGADPNSHRDLKDCLVKGFEGTPLEGCSVRFMGNLEGNCRVVFPNEERLHEMMDKSVELRSFGFTIKLKAPRGTSYTRCMQCLRGDHTLAHCPNPHQPKCAVCGSFAHCVGWDMKCPDGRNTHCRNVEMQSIFCVNCCQPGHLPGYPGCAVQDPNKMVLLDDNGAIGPRPSPVMAPNAGCHTAFPPLPHQHAPHAHAHAPPAPAPAPAPATPDSDSVLLASIVDGVRTCIARHKLDRTASPQLLSMASDVLLYAIGKLRPGSAPVMVAPVVVEEIDALVSAVSRAPVPSLATPSAVSRAVRPFGFAASPRPVVLRRQVATPGGASPDVFPRLNFSSSGSSDGSPRDSANDRGALGGGALQGFQHGGVPPPPTGPPPDLPTPPPTPSPQASPQSLGSGTPEGSASSLPSAPNSSSHSAGSDLDLNSLSNRVQEGAAVDGEKEEGGKGGGPGKGEGEEGKGVVEGKEGEQVEERQEEEQRDNGSNGDNNSERTNANANAASQGSSHPSNSQ